MKLKFKVIVKYLHHISATVLALFICAVAVAQLRFVTVVHEKQAGLTDYVEVEYTIENAKSVQRIDFPLFKNFRVIQGPVQSNGMSYMNGVLSQYKSISYVLQPLTTGKLSIPGAVAIINGKEMRSNSVILDVTRSAPGNTNSTSRAFSPWPVEPDVEEEYVVRPGESISEKIKKNILVKTEINKTTCYVGEPIMLTFKLCSRLRSESRVIKRPSLNGFSVYDMIEPESNNPSVEKINGKTYNVHLIRKTQLFPLQHGTFVIDPVELNNTVKFLNQGSNQSEFRTPMQQLMDDFMNEDRQGMVEEHTFTLSSKPVTVTVKPLPMANRPPGFNGAIGKFNMAADLNHSSVVAGEAVHLMIRIKGEGNFMVINPPSIKLSRSLDSYDPAIKENVDKTVYPLSGSKTFDYTFVTKDTGSFKVSPVVFSYFDPSESKYKTARSDSFNINVFASDKKKKSGKQFIVAGQTSSRSSWIDAISIQHLVYFMMALLVGGFGLFQWKKNREERKLNLSLLLLNAKHAAEMAKADPLEEARWFMKEGKSQRFYAEVNKAIWKKLAEVLFIPVTDLNKNNMFVQLQRKGTGEETIRQLEIILKECEIALYTPVHEYADMQQILVKAEEVIKAL